MEDLGLTEFANKKISELSGGQKRRVSIGIELGRFGSSTASPMNLISFSIKNPATVGIPVEAIPTLEACAR